MAAVMAIAAHQHDIAAGLSIKVDDLIKWG